MGLGQIKCGRYFLDVGNTMNVYVIRNQDQINAYELKHMSLLFLTSWTAKDFGTIYARFILRCWPSIEAISWSLQQFIDSRHHCFPIVSQVFLFSTDTTGTTVNEIE